MSYVRSAPKGHGRGNLIEGEVRAGSRVVVIEDLVSTGGSVLAAAEALRQAGAEPVAVLAVFTYGFADAHARFDTAGLPLRTLTDFETLVRVAEVDGTLAPGALASLRDWRADPEGWGP